MKTPFDKFWGSTNNGNFFSDKVITVEDLHRVAMEAWNAALMRLPEPEHIHTSENYESCAECVEKVRQARIKNNHHAISNMERALQTYRVRNRVYGNNYKRFGVMMASFYPNGVTIKTAHEWNRFGIILQMVSKLSRYVTDPHAGHIDSIHDNGVYSFMLEELDAEQAGLDVLPPIHLRTQEPATKEDIKVAVPSDCEHIYQWPCYKQQRVLQCNKGTTTSRFPLVHSCGKQRCIQCGEEAPGQ